MGVLSRRKFLNTGRERVSTEATALDKLAHIFLSKPVSCLGILAIFISGGKYGL